MNKQEEILEIFKGGGYKNPADFHFKPNNLIEDYILAEMRKLLYNIRNGHLKPLELLAELEKINDKTNTGFNVL